MKASQTALLILTMVPVAAGCDGTPVEGDQTGEVESTQGAIYNGQPIASQTDAGPLGVPQILFGGGACSAVVYNKYWLITAAHCFNAGQDPQGDWVYWSTDISGNHYAQFLQTSASNGAGQLNILAAFRSPDIYQDTALVLLDPTSAGVYMPTLQDQTTAPTRYSNGHLVIYAGSIASLVGYQVLGYGWGYSGVDQNGNSTYNGFLNRGWKNVTNYDTLPLLYYSESKYNDAGTNCLGDSGGPDFWWDGGGFQLTGIHGQGNDPCNGAGGGRNNGAEAFRTWVKETAATVPMNGTVTSEQLSNDWSASNASDYNPSTSYSSNSFSSSANTRGVWLQTYLATASTVNRVNMRARCFNFGGRNFGDDYNAPACVVNGFPASYNVHVWNGAWTFSGTFTAQPNNLGVVSLAIPAVSNATAVRVTPVTLGTDITGTYYFQMAELQPANDL